MTRELGISAYRTPPLSVEVGSDDTGTLIGYATVVIDPMIVANVYLTLATPDGYGAETYSWQTRYVLRVAWYETGYRALYFAGDDYMDAVEGVSFEEVGVELWEALEVGDFTEVLDLLSDARGLTLRLATAEEVDSVADLPDMGQQAVELLRSLEARAQTRWEI